MKIAIYSRKSKFTGKGDSIENQIQMCQEYCTRLYDETVEFVIYEDEGFSGGNTNRPKFQELIRDASNKKFDVLICYRLDRISRNVADFSTTLELLQKHNIAFISIKEQFDTSTPMGKAMVYIASVFAQLERETIAERVRDNMLELAKSGRWLGGQTPLGFKSEEIIYFDQDFKERKMYKLTSIPDEMKTVKLIYDKYLELKSLSQVAKYLDQNFIKTKTGKDVWNKSGIQDILVNPVYVKADKDVILYLSDLGMTVVGNPDGKHGILTYNKKRGKAIYRDIEEWVAAIAKHEGVINTKDWLMVQKLLQENKEKAPRLGKTHNALLTGILKCAKCGSTMKVIHGRNKSGKVFYYKCTLKNSSGNTRCDNANVRTDDIEKILKEKLKEYSLNKGLLRKEVEEYKKELLGTKSHEFKSIDNIKKDIDNKKKQIENLVNQMSLSPVAAKYIIPQIENLNKEIEDYQKKLTDVETSTNLIFQADLSLEMIFKCLDKMQIIDELEDEEVKLIYNVMLDSVLWDGDTGNLTIKFWGDKKKLLL